MKLQCPEKHAAIPGLLECEANLFLISSLSMCPPPFQCTNSSEAEELVYKCSTKTNFFMKYKVLEMLPEMLRIKIFHMEREKICYLTVVFIDINIRNSVLQPGCD